MSRCFPFPPPGYEKKARTDDVDFLKKEKQKEKHKKEKDKEKRENKEKNEKDRSDGKHKDKKEKKEKHKDKKKDKDRDKEKKDGSNNSVGKKFHGHPERQNGEKTADEKKLPGKFEGHNGEKLIPKEKGRDKDRSSFSSEKKLGRFLGNNGEKVSQNSSLAEEFGDAKFVQELGRRVRDEGARAGNRLVEKFMGTEPKREEGMVRLVTKTATAFTEEKEKNKRSDDRKLDVQGIRDERRPGGKAIVQNIDVAVNTRVEGVLRQVESNTDKRDEWKDKTKEKGSDDKIRDKHKDNDREKKGHGKDKDRDKEEEKKKKKKKKKKKEEKEKEKEKAKGECRNLESVNLKGSNKDVPVGTNNLKASDYSKEGNKGGVVEENHRKRKDCGKNGFFHINDVKPNKLLKTTLSLSTDNGRTLEPCEAPIPLASDSHRLGTGLMVDAEEAQIPLASDSHRAGTGLMVDAEGHKLNGINEGQLSYISPTKHSSATTVSPTNHLSASAQASQMDVVSTRPPHPDSKYLSQVLSVPEMEEWSDFDEQSWLFHNNEYQSKKPKVGFSDIDEAPQVWAEALQIESADVCALPYVIPY